jgi:hypothetical protein
MAKNATKDQEMAKRLKDENVRRTVGRCPICNKLVSVGQLQVHISYHPA